MASKWSFDVAFVVNVSTVKLRQISDASKLMWCPYDEVAVWYKLVG